MRSPTKSTLPAPLRWAFRALAAAVVLVLLVAVGFVVGVKARRGTFRPQHPGTVRFALCQMDSRVGDIPWNFHHAMRYAEEAASHGADVIVLPEFSFTTVHDLRRGRAWFNIGHEHWMSNTVASFTRRHHAYLIYNHPFTFGARGEHHLNETRIVGPDGAIVTNYQKIVMALLDRRVNIGPSLQGPVVAELPFTRIGMLICKDTAEPDHFAGPYQEADLLLAQFAHITHWGHKEVPSGLREQTIFAPDVFPRIGRMWHGILRKTLLMVNKSGLEDDFAYIGGSRVIDVEGRPLSEANSCAAIVYADFALGADGRIDADNPTIPENPTDRVLEGRARKWRTSLRRLAVRIP